MRIAKSFAFLAVAFVAIAIPTTADAQTQTAAPAANPATEAVAQQAIGELRSPYCPGLMLEVCPSPGAEFLRDSIRAMAAQGVPAKAIVEDVLARHGEEWRAVPKRSGAGVWAWLMPPFVLLFGGGVVFWWLKRMRGRSDDLAPASAEGLSDEERARLDAALREWESAEAAP